MRLLARLLVVGAAATALAVPAAPAQASCEGTFVFNCIRELLPDTSQEICVIRDDTTGTYVCV